jgi:hypothetical protein
MSIGWEGGFGFLHSTKFLYQQDGKTDLDSYTAQNSGLRKRLNRNGFITPACNFGQRNSRRKMGMSVFK